MMGGLNNHSRRRANSCQLPCCHCICFGWACPRSLPFLPLGAFIVGPLLGLSEGCFGALASSVFTPGFRFGSSRVGTPEFYAGAVSPLFKAGAGGFGRVASSLAALRRFVRVPASCVLRLQSNSRARGQIRANLLLSLHLRRALMAHAHPPGFSDSPMPAHHPNLPPLRGGFLR